jgi:hypothetical protein
VNNCGDAGAGASKPASKPAAKKPAAAAAKKAARGRRVVLSDDEADDEMDAEDDEEEEEDKEEDDEDSEEEDEDEVTKLTKNILAKKDSKAKKSSKPKAGKKNAFDAFTFNKKKASNADASDDDDEAFAGVSKGFEVYASEVYCQSTQRPGPAPHHFDLIFQCYTKAGDHYPFKNCDQTGNYAPGKETSFLRSKIAVGRYLERTGMSEEDLELLALDFTAAKKAAESEAAAGAEFIIANLRKSVRASAPRRTLKDASSDDEDSDLLESDEERPAGGEGDEDEEMEPLEKIEKIIFCAEAGDVSAEDLAALASDEAKEVAKAAKGKKGGRKPLLYCVKWEGCSFRRRSWETEDAVHGFAAPKLASFKRRHSANPNLTMEPFHPNFLVIDRVVDAREAGAEEQEDDEEKEEDEEEEETDPMQYLVKWRGSGYSEATWESGDDLKSPEDVAEIALYNHRNSLKAKRAMHAGVAERQKSGVKPAVKPTPPPFKNGMALREYQVTSFEWMVGNYRCRKNVILGDEMGLGKTAQCISVMEHVRTAQLRAPRPFLVIAPLTTLGHWKREMEKWTDMNVVLLDGNAEDRRVCKETEFYFEGRGAKGPAKFDVLLVSFETARRLNDLVASFDWALCVVDEVGLYK